MGIAVRALRQMLLRKPPRRYQVFVGRHLPGSHDWPVLLEGGGPPQRAG